MKISKVPFIIFILILFLFTILVGGKLPYYLFYVSIFSISIPLVHNLYSIRNIKGYITLPDARVYKGDNIDIQYKVDNNGSLSIPYIEIEDQISKTLQNKKSKNTILSLDKKDSYHKREAIQLNRRGYYKIVAIKVIIRDVLGIYSLKKTISNDSSLLVYPKPIELNNLSGVLSQTSGEITVKESNQKDKSSIHSFREYIPGDEIKSVHWKLSGKFDNLIVKEYENSSDTNIILLIDNSIANLKSDENMRIEDKIVDIALSIVNYSLREHINIKLYSQDNEFTNILEGNQESDLKVFLESFAKLKANGVHDYNAFIESQNTYLRKEKTLILISPLLDKKIAARIIDFKIKGSNIIFILVTDIENNWRPIDLNIEERLYQEDIKVYMIDYRSSVKDVLEGYNGYIYR